jgi:hypothetical protein
MYGNVEIKYSKFGVDDFDFASVCSKPSPFALITNTVTDTTIKHHILGWKLISPIHMPIPCCSCSALRH